MPLDTRAIEKGCAGAKVTTAHHLCRSELSRFDALLATGQPMTVGCTQEAPLFSERASELDGATPAFANPRETGGWSQDAGRAGPKMAALLAMAAEPLPEVTFVSLTSEGKVLTYGRDAAVFEAATLL